MAKYDDQSSGALARRKHGPDESSATAKPPADQPTAPSDALIRLKASGAQSAATPVKESEASSTEEPEASAEPPKHAVQQPKKAPKATKKPKKHKVKSADRWTWRDKLNAWLDSFRGPSPEDIEQAIANTPARIQARWQKIQDDRLEARLAAEHARQLAAEVEEARQALEEQRERESERMAELERQQQAEERRKQQARETQALLRAAQEMASDDVPAPENRPMLQRDDEYLNDEELFERAQKNLPEWQRLDRLVNKARSIEQQTPPPPPSDTVEAVETDEEFVMPFRKPVTDDPDPQHLDGFRRATLTISWVLFVIVGLFSLGWMGTWPSILEAHDGLYAGATSLMSMAAWHVLAWPLLWLATLLYVGYQWAPSQYSAVRNRTTAWYVSNAMLLAAGTKLLAHFQDWGLEALTAIAATVLLARAVTNLNRYTERTAKERYLVDVPIGGFTGWMLIFSATTVFTAMASWEVLDLLWIPEIIWAILVILGLLVVLSRLSLTGRGRMSIVLGFAFGMTAIIGTRLFGDNTSFIVVGVALLGLFIVLAATENRRYQIAVAEKRAMEHLVYADAEDD